MRAWIALLSAAVILLAGCGADTDGANADASGADTAPTSTTDGGDAAKGDRTGAVPASLDFTGTTLVGETFEGAGLAGKPAVLWFWAPWCPTCRAQIPNITALAEKHQGDVAVVGVGGLATGDQISEMAESIPHLTHLVDTEGTVWNHFEVTAQSTYEVIDSDGEIVHSGYLDDGDLNELVADLAG